MQQSQFLRDDHRKERIEIEPVPVLRHELFEAVSSVLPPGWDDLLDPIAEDMIAKGMVVIVDL
jgi:hypothetical protein